MTDVAISVEGLSKRYRVGRVERRHDTLLGALSSIVSSPLANYRRLQRLSTFDDTDSDDVIWALRDVAFEVKSGEVLGVIGRNGAGKSTLLKILSRITEPTTGRVVLNGRVASLLEVGTGFHPELTGRENVYLNATLLGMTRRDVARKFDDIVAFAELEKFIDTPVKRYSSGMRVRLAFAVSAYLEPEILLVDEVLAVGDASFQAKCLDKLDGAARAGRTVLFVSHNMQAVQRLCTRALLVDRGRVAADDRPESVVSRYLMSADLRPATGPILSTPEIEITQIVALQGDVPTTAIDSARPFEIRIDYRLFEPVSNLLLGFDVVSEKGGQLFRTYDLLALGLGARGPGRRVSTLRFPGCLFHSEACFFELLVGVHRQRWLSNGRWRLRLDFERANPVDVGFPGTLQPQGTWTVTESCNAD